MDLWSRYVTGFINHDKFRAITANAICLWLEGKGYADEHHTDGLLPDYEVKHWRFYGRKSVALLTASAGLKPGTDRPYAPLWEVVADFGFKMHDYLAHNDCREVVLARIAKADAARAERNKNQQEYREREKAKREAAALSEKVITESVTRYNSSSKVTDKQKHNHKHNHKQTLPSEELQQSDARSKRPIYQSDRFVVFEWQLDDIGRMLGAHLDAFDLHAFFDDLTQKSRDQGLVIPSDREARWRWLQAQVEAEARRRGLPMATVEATVPTNKRIAGLMAGGEAFLNRRRG